MDEKFEYTDTDNGIMITGIDRNAGVIEIPDNIDEKPVTGIGRYAFSERLELTDVILPRSVVDIGAHSFYNCKNLEHVELHDGIRELEDGAFKNCYNLRYITMYCHQGREGCIRNLMSDNIQELQLDIIYDNGERSRLIFPTFEDDYVENTPARIFQAVSYGTCRLEPWITGILISCLNARCVRTALKRHSITVSEGLCIHTACTHRLRIGIRIFSGIMLRVRHAY